MISLARVRAPISIYVTKHFLPLFRSHTSKNTGPVYQITSYWAHQIALGSPLRSYAFVRIFLVEQMRSYGCEAFYLPKQIALTRACGTVSICTELVHARAILMWKICSAKACERERKWRGDNVSLVRVQAGQLRKLSRTSTHTFYGS